MRIHREVPRSFFTHLVSSTKNGVIDTRGLYRPLPKRIQNSRKYNFSFFFFKREKPNKYEALSYLSPLKREERVSPHSQRVNIEEYKKGLTPSHHTRMSTIDSGENWTPPRKNRTTGVPVFEAERGLFLSILLPSGNWG